MNRKKLYRLYIDESGDHNYTDTDEPSKRYLGLVGIIFEFESYKEAHKECEDLKQKHFSYDPDDPIIFHRRDILRKKGPFYVLQDPKKEKDFNKDLLDFLLKQEFTIIVVVIDKKSHKQTYGESAFHPYHYCLRAMLERYCGLLNHLNNRGDVLAESRGRKEDEALKVAYRTTRNIVGTFYRLPPFFQRALTSKEIKIKKKKDNITGLQIADLLAYPCTKELLYEEKRISKPLSAFTGRIINIIKLKYNRQLYTGKIKGYGKIFLK